MTLPAGVLRRLDRRKQVASQPHELTPAPAPEPAHADAVAMANDYGSRFSRMVRDYQRHNGGTREEATAALTQPDAWLERQTLQGPPDDVAWEGMDALAVSNPDAFLKRWEEIKEAAREEQRRGLHASLIVEGYSSTPWTRAVFLAARAAIADGFQPRNDLEWQLIDQGALAQVELWHWQRILQAEGVAATLGVRMAIEQKKSEKGLKRDLSRLLSVEETTGYAMSMVERWQRIYLRALEALQRMRRGKTAVVVKRAGQVNVGQNQVNLSSARG